MAGAGFIYSTTEPNEGDGEEMERFWNDLDRIVDRVGMIIGCVLGDVNG